LRNGWSPARLLLLLAYIVAFDIQFYIRPQFTMTAALAAQAAMVLWVAGTWRGEALSWPALIFFLGLMTLAAAVRFESCILVVMLAAPALVGCVVRVWRNAGAGTPWPRRLRQLVDIAGVPFAAAGLLMIGAKIYNDEAYRSQGGWSSFHDFNYLRAQFTDYDRATYSPETRWIFDEAGWSENDFCLLQYWFFPDPKVYNVRTFKQVLAHFPRGWSSHWVEGLRYELDDEPHLRMMFLAAVLPIFFMSRKDGSRTVYMLTLGAMALTFGLLIGYYSRLPAWVTWSILAFPICLSLVLSETGLPRKWIGNPQFLLQAGAIVLMLLLSWEALALSFNWKRDMRGISGKLRDALRRIDPQAHQLYVVVGWGVFELLLSSRDLEALRPFKLFGPGYAIQSPINDARLREFGIEDIYSAMFRRNDVFVFSDPILNRRIIQYVKEHHGISIKAQEVFKAAVTPYHLFGVYRFSETPRSVETVGILEKERLALDDDDGDEAGVNGGADQES
jgi:hypothetical protein